MDAVMPERPMYWMLHPDRSVTPCSFEERCTLTHEQRRVALDDIGEAQVSTVFLSLDHAYDGPPLLFETMVFGGPLNEHQWRYGTWDEAVAGHAAACAQVRQYSSDSGDAV